MGGYTFRLATMADRPAIIAFMRRHWGEKHPLIECDDFFTYYYADGTRGPSALNMALCEADGALCALAGFILASQAAVPDVWVSLWVADPAAQGSGLELMDAMPALIGCRTLACNNIRPKTRSFYEFLGHTTGRVGHFYRLAARPHYAVATPPPGGAPPALPVAGNGTLAPVPTARQLQASGFVPPANANPYKDMWYLCRRYYAFPRQPYQVYLAHLPGVAAPAALLATRTVPVAGTAVLRVVDYLGEAALLPRLGAALDNLMRQAAAEYMDFYCAGIPAKRLAAAGFRERTPGDGLVLPNYLTPLLRQNTEYYYFTSRPAGFVLCRADGDQDRPHIPLD